VKVLGAIGSFVVNTRRKLVAIAPVVNGCFCEIWKTKHCSRPKRAQVERRQRVVGWFCCVSDFRSGVPAQDEPVPFSTNKRQNPALLRNALRVAHNYEPSKDY
jgi:hypothetical protein